MDICIRIEINTLPLNKRAIIIKNLLYSIFFGELTIVFIFIELNQNQPQQHHQHLRLRIVQAQI